MAVDQHVPPSSRTPPCGATCGTFWQFLSKALTWYFLGELCVPSWEAQKDIEGGKRTGLVTPGTAQRKDKINIGMLSASKEPEL